MVDAHLLPLTLLAQTVYYLDKDCSNPGFDRIRQFIGTLSIVLLNNIP